jgi:hypothetical protein
MFFRARLSSEEISLGVLPANALAACAIGCAMAYWAIAVRPSASAKAKKKPTWLNT